LLIFICHEYVCPVGFKFYISGGCFVCHSKVELNRIPELRKVIFKDKIQAVRHIEVNVLKLLDNRVIILVYSAEKGIEDRPVKTKIQGDPIKHCLAQELAEEVK